MSQNFDLKEQIRDYWSARADTFDESFSHKISEGIELDTWMAIYANLLGSGKKHVLDLGCGTGEISKVLFALGHQVTGLDFSDAMLAKARAKHADKGERATYLSGDAELTQLSEATFDSVTCRHLVWTLLEPEQALADWYRVLKPGGHLIIFDGNFMAKSLSDRLLQKLISKISPTPTSKLQAQNETIRSRLKFSNGLDFEELKFITKDAGFQDVTRHSYTPIRRAQRRIAGPADWLRSFTKDRFILHAMKY